ncbi:hypothetical protein [Methylococcus geothermalis]|uniref:Uncharacterized protein n=1 Tax=Methylococcus geothermalis TaxID=2681310 RepID=A0A858Q5Q9_9GAMM|nr:hypothetical protein [Methylococcus geothermalis]QJD29169.1 hypothetical protein GNH96_03765 [Methylococcus geothermalis]
MSDSSAIEAGAGHGHPDLDARVRVLARRFPPYHRDSPCLAILDRFLRDPALAAASCSPNTIRRPKA